jgi:hypothetical protein
MGAPVVRAAAVVVVVVVAGAVAAVGLTIVRVIVAADVIAAVVGAQAVRVALLGVAFPPGFRGGVFVVLGAVAFVVGVAAVRVAVVVTVVVMVCVPFILAWLPPSRFAVRGAAQLGLAR